MNNCCGIEPIVSENAAAIPVNSKNRSMHFECVMIGINRSKGDEKKHIICSRGKPKYSARERVEKNDNLEMLSKKIKKEFLS